MCGSDDLWIFGEGPNHVLSNLGRNSRHPGHFRRKPRPRVGQVGASLLANITVQLQRALFGQLDDLSPIITHHYAVEQFEKAFATMQSGQSGKVILDWAA